ncbi:hypothetical protein ACFX1R_024625 [Malus domestica]
MEEGSSAATAWIDGIIKDIIHSSTNVPIPQFIHNVREIIFPCNPSLATLLGYRLRSISDPPPPFSLLSTKGSKIRCRNRNSRDGDAFTTQPHKKRIIHLQLAVRSSTASVGSRT